MEEKTVLRLTANEAGIRTLFKFTGLQLSRMEINGEDIRSLASELAKSGMVICIISLSEFRYKGAKYTANYALSQLDTAAKYAIKNREPNQLKAISAVLAELNPYDLGRVYCALDEYAQRFPGYVYDANQRKARIKQVWLKLQQKIRELKKHPEEKFANRGAKPFSSDAVAANNIPTKKELIEKYSLGTIHMGAIYTKRKRI